MIRRADPRLLAGGQAEWPVAERSGRWLSGVEATGDKLSADTGTGRNPGATDQRIAGQPDRMQKPPRLRATSVFLFRRCVRHEGARGTTHRPNRKGIPQ